MLIQAIRSRAFRWPGGVGWASKVTMFAAVSLAGVAATACGSTPGPTAVAPATTLTYGQGDLRSVYCTGSGSTKACGGLVPAPVGLTDRIVLDRIVVPTGTSIHALVVVDNHTGHSIALRDPHGCQPSMAVAVTNATIAPGVGFALVCSAQPLMLDQGITRFPVDVITTYAGCGPSTTVRSSKASLPVCLPHGGVPNLPAGSYHAVLIGLELALPQATVPVSLTAQK
jgi:hypothetical protein